MRFKKHGVIAAAGAMAIAAALSVPALSAGANRADSTSTGPEPSPPTVGSDPSALPIPYNDNDILALAKAKAARLGDPSPSLVEHSAIVPRSAASSIATPGDTVDSTAPSLVIAIRGTFTTKAAVPAPLAPMAATNPPPTLHYSVITLVVDATTGDITDYGLASEYPDLSTLGPVTTDSSTG